VLRSGSVLNEPLDVNADSRCPPMRSGSLPRSDGGEGEGRAVRQAPTQIKRVGLGLIARRLRNGRKVADILPM
jgi:hypothetical protein